MSASSWFYFKNFNKTLGYMDRLYDLVARVSGYI